MPKYGRQPNVSMMPGIAVSIGIVPFDIDDDAKHTLAIIADIYYNYGNIQPRRRLMTLSSILMDILVVLLLALFFYKARKADLLSNVNAGGGTYLLRQAGIIAAFLPL